MFNIDFLWMYRIYVSNDKDSKEMCHISSSRRIWDWLPGMYFLAANFLVMCELAFTSFYLFWTPYPLAMLVEAGRKVSFNWLALHSKQKIRSDQMHVYIWEEENKVENN